MDGIKWEANYTIQREPGHTGVNMEQCDDDLSILSEFISFLDLTEGGYRNLYRYEFPR